MLLAKRWIRSRNGSDQARAGHFVLILSGSATGMEEQAWRRSGSGFDSSQPSSWNSIFSASISLVRQYGQTEGERYCRSYYFLAQIPPQSCRTLHRKGFQSLPSPFSVSTLHKWFKMQQALSSVQCIENNWSWFVFPNRGATRADSRLCSIWQNRGQIAAILMYSSATLSYAARLPDSKRGFISIGSCPSYLPTRSKSVYLLPPTDCFRGGSRSRKTMTDCAFNRLNYGTKECPSIQSKLRGKVYSMGKWGEGDSRHWGPLRSLPSTIVGKTRGGLILTIYLGVCNIATSFRKHAFCSVICTVNLQQWGLIHFLWNTLDVIEMIFWGWTPFRIVAWGKGGPGGVWKMAPESKKRNGQRETERKRRRGEKEWASDLIQRLSYQVKTVLEKKGARKKTFLALKDSLGNPLSRSPFKPSELERLSADAFLWYINFAVLPSRKFSQPSPHCLLTPVQSLWCHDVQTFIELNWVLTMFSLGKHSGAGRTRP